MAEFRCPHGHLNCCGHHDNQDTPMHQPACSQTEPYEEVDHPAHYQLPGGVEVIDLVEDMGFCLGNALKYLLRAGRKPGVTTETDLMKAVWYIEREIIRLERLKERHQTQRDTRKAQETLSRLASMTASMDAGAR